MAIFVLWQKAGASWVSEWSPTSGCTLTRLFLAGIVCAGKEHMDVPHVNDVAYEYHSKLTCDDTCGTIAMHCVALPVWQSTFVQSEPTL